MKPNNLEAWHQSSLLHPVTLIHQLFEAQVERDPDAVAVTFPATPEPTGELAGLRQRREEKLTYRELNQRANQLAHYLKALGVGPEVPVGICLERSLEMVIGILGILKAGGAYVPLELAYPTERLSFILEDTQMPAVLTESQLLEKLPEHQAKLICLDGDRETIAQEDTENPESEGGAHSLAYVIYTSGSTGNPKGVLVSHHNVVRLFEATHPWFGFDERDVWTLFHSYAFDFSVWELWGTLLYGGRLVVVPYWMSRSPEAFYDLLRREKVTVLNQTPSAFRQLIRAEESLGTADDLALRVIIFGGEALDFNSLRPWFERHGDQDPQLVNMYGITETTVHVTYRPVTIADLKGVTGSLIGVPIPDLQVHILDQRSQPVPIGISGELYVGGAGVARGYLNRPELTAERFVPDPFSDRRGARLYKSGDMARYLPNGDIEYLGRIDHQVKIRGFRIELGEIEALLGEHPLVQEKVVLARDDVVDDKRLVAYIVPRGEVTDINSLRRYLRKKLPDYMVPSAFVMLDGMPLTPNGKIDRRALPVPGRGRPDLETAYVAPRSELEHFLTDLWREVLGIEGIGIRDNFFELGGDSLKGAVFVNRLQAALGEYVYIVALFDAPTVADLAAHLNEQYPAGVARICGQGSGQGKAGPGQAKKIDQAKLAQVRQMIRPLATRETVEVSATSKNPPMIFILTPPRSGSTLLRVMLAGHPRLFAPPELELLSFNTLKQRKVTLSGGDSFRSAGTIRAIMAIKEYDLEQAQKIMEAYEDQDLTTKQFYRVIQNWIEPRILVDKSTFYALDLETLKHGESDFDHPYYIHLVRQPYGMIRSFEEARSDRIYFKDQRSFSVREIAELTWLICHQNILTFLEEVPGHRQYRIKFEDLVNQPKHSMEEMCQWLGLESDPGMLQPYREKKAKMTDGIYPTSISRMLGDVKFHKHKDIDPGVADRWQEYFDDDFLGDITWQVAETLGYQRLSKLSKATPEGDAPQSRGELEPIQPIPRSGVRRGNAEQLLVNLDRLADEELDVLLEETRREEGVNE
jgi:amino acid adenylation domain-containing protein